MRSISSSSRSDPSSDLVRDRRLFEAERERPEADPDLDRDSDPDPDPEPEPELGIKCSSDMHRKVVPDLLSFYVDNGPKFK